MDHHQNNNEVIERRNYFRIEDTVLLRLIAVDREAALANQIPSQFNQDLRFTLVRELQDIDHDAQRYLRSIAEDNRDLEAYLKSINKKIDLLTATLANTVEPQQEQTKHAVSLSEGGLAFMQPSKLNKGSYVAIELTLLPSYITLVLFARVMDCTAIEAGFKIALSFVNLRDSDRQSLAKHIMQQQLAAKRQHNNQKDYS